MFAVIWNPWEQDCSGLEEVLSLFVPTHNQSQVVLDRFCILGILAEDVSIPIEKHSGNCNKKILLSLQEVAERMVRYLTIGYTSARHFFFKYCQQNFAALNVILIFNIIFNINFNIIAEYLLHVKCLGICSQSVYIHYFT